MPVAVNPGENEPVRHSSAGGINLQDRINDHAIHRLDELLPWNWAAEMERRKLAA
jgi:hypothetical protein